MIWTCDTWNAKAYMKWAGARVVLAEGGRSRVELKVEAHHRGAADTEHVNGAILAYLHDVAQGAAVRSLCGDDVKAIATLNLNVSYVSFARADEVLVGEGRVLKMHQAVAFAESDFRSAEGSIFCHATGTFRIMRKNKREKD
jgi:uncharacterized protein (TIGR00369 family)